MTKNLRASAGFALGMILCGSVLAGCVGDGDKGRLISANSNDLNNRAQAERQRLQNNSHIPPQARAAAVQVMDTGERNYQQMQQQRTARVAP